MEKIKIFESFSGIGAQAKALENLRKKIKGFSFEVVGTSDWDIYANIAYSAIHHGIDGKIFESEPDAKEVYAFLNDKVISKNGNDPYNAEKLNIFDARLLREAMISSNNIGSIVDSYDRFKKGVKELPNLLTYSFPCQDLSSVGSLHGYNKGFEGKRSGLLFEIEKLLSNFSKKDRPKVLMMENVHNLINKRNIDDFKDWIKRLKALGYRTYFSEIDSRTHNNSLQRRKRVFAVSIKDDKLNKESDDLLPLLEKYFKKNKDLKIIEDIMDLSMNEYNDNFKIRRTPSREKMLHPNWKIHPERDGMRTVTKVQDRWPNAGWIPYGRMTKDHLAARFISPLESMLLMEFDEKDYKKVYDVLTKVRKNSKSKTETFVTTKIYQLAGNSIIVGILEAIFEFIYKEVLNG